MSPEEYAAAQAVITAGLAAHLRRFATMFALPLLTPRQWLQLLQLLFPEVEKRYEQSASLGRNFYDSQRKKYHPDLTRNEMFTSELGFEWFVKSMEPARKEMSQADSPSSAVTRMVLTAVREVEMAGRRQIIGAVKSDPEKKILQGWARIATGRETCAWCLMLISRGAEFPGKDTLWYLEANTAGLDLDDESAIELYRQYGSDLEKFREETEEFREQWHTGCDCLVVPVFDVKDWPGRQQAQRAQQLWIDASREADKLIEAGKSRTNNMNRETINALRRRIERGDISMSNYAIAA